MIDGGWVCALHVRTSGLGGAALGSDEQEIVYLAYTIIDVPTNKIIGEREYTVQPTKTPLEESQTGPTLEFVIQQFDEFVSSLQIDPHSPLFRLVTDGQQPLRQCLHPEAITKDILLPTYYARFHDLRKEFVRAYTLRAVSGSHAPPPPDYITSMLDMLNYLGITPTSYETEVKGIVIVTQRIISDGFRLELPETIDLVLETGILSKEDEIDGNCIVRVRGFLESTDQDIAKFFRGLNLARNGVVLCLSPHGRRHGEALVRFISQEHRDMALKRHKHHIGSQCIEVYRASGEDFLFVAGSDSARYVVEPGTSKSSKPWIEPDSIEELVPVTPVPQHVITSGVAKNCIRLRGLPYETQVEHLLTFLEEFAKNIAAQGVHMVYNAQGHPSGEAFIRMDDESSASLCAQQKHGQSMSFGKKQCYIEVFQCSGDDMSLILTGVTPETLPGPLTYWYPSMGPPLPPPPLEYWGMPGNSSDTGGS